MGRKIKFIVEAGSMHGARRLGVFRKPEGLLNTFQGFMNGRMCSPTLRTFSACSLLSCTRSFVLLSSSRFYPYSRQSRLWWPNEDSTCSTKSKCFALIKRRTDTGSLDLLGPPNFGEFPSSVEGACRGSRLT